MTTSSGGMGRVSFGPNPQPKYKKSVATKKHKTISAVKSTKKRK